MYLAGTRLNHSAKATSQMSHDALDVYHPRSIHKSWAFFRNLGCPETVAP
uniref:Uncharacterized protein n=1 Tax=Physcomitrium patens TaxID=3218 RepID=A0A2K1ICP5_PHYPA|nr:hypothetical protein PHYPA_030534 [Physcomitrium patens]